MTQKWQKDSWRNLPIKQQPTYNDKVFLREVENKISNFPPLVSFDEVDNLQNELANVANGKAFLLQGGDCAESFVEFSHKNLKGFFRTIMQMTIALMYGSKKPVVKVGRIAGQYAKPRSTDEETKNGISFPSYRGDIINSIEFEEKARISDPNRLIEAYFHSAASLNYLRSLAQGGYGNLDKISQWNEEFVHSLKSKQNSEEVIVRIKDSLNFINACGLDHKILPQLTTASFFTSHEALLLNYQQCFAKQNNDNKKYYDLSAHMLWIGDRTRNPKEAHVEYMRGISNPIAFKVGPTINKDDLLSLLDILNPKNEAGRITLISRMGQDKVNDYLPPLIEAVKKNGNNVIWSCDPMHGNTIKSSSGIKTRKFDDILSEIKSFFEIHRQIGTYAGGIHFEMTGQDVTECLGGNQQISELDLIERYHTHCDPRLNGSQSVELAFMIAQDLTKY